MENTVSILMITLGIAIIGGSILMNKKNKKLEGNANKDIVNYLKKRILINIIVGAISIMTGAILLFNSSQIVSLVLLIVLFITIIVGWSIDLSLRKKIN
ncbi:putative membrane protein [Clostridium bornimense]|uniref:Putative membrane protein n=1 Tax=Clostridium bornimense TaxID=1216932 RepID=W6RSL5_9CLOT|nr:hypothetical protein [Clostridium bornimense]CDM67238.1 putative membrane protein [Clostridium bornimense]